MVYWKFSHHWPKCSGTPRWQWQLNSVSEGWWICNPLGKLPFRIVDETMLSFLRGGNEVEKVPWTTHWDKVYWNSYPFRVTSASLQHGGTEEGFHSVLIQDSFSTPTFLSKIMKMTSLLVQYVLSTWVLNRRNIQSWFRFGSVPL